MLEETLSDSNRVKNHSNEIKLDERIYNKLEQLDFIIELYNDKGIIEFYEKSKEYLLYVINELNDYETGNKLFAILYKKINELIIDINNLNGGYKNTYEVIINNYHPAYDKVDAEEFTDLQDKHNELVEDYSDIIDKYNKLCRKHIKLVEKYFEKTE